MKPLHYFAAMLAFVVMFASGCAGNATSSSTGEFIDDTVITTKVKAALVQDPDLSALEISVETFKGVVQLSGFVDTQAEITKAGQVARNIEGVNSVQNDITLK